MKEKNRVIFRRSHLAQVFILCFCVFNSSCINSEKHSEKTSSSDEQILSLAQDFLFPDLKNILVFLDNHDLGRFSLEEDADLRKYKQGIAFLLTTRGIPQIYYGTEIAMTGTKEAGDGGIRKDFPGGWNDDPVNAFKAEDRTPKQNEAWDYMKKLLHWRTNNKAVTEGSLIHYSPNDNGCYVYARIKDDKTVLVILNGSNKDQLLSMDRYSDVIGSNTKGADVISGQELDIKSPINVPARGVFVMDLKK